MNFTLSPRRAGCLLSAALATALLAAGPASAAQPAVQVHSSCAGDTISGWVQVKSKGQQALAVSLMAKRTANAPFAGMSQASVKAGDGQRSAFSFDISEYDAFAYRVDASGVQGRVLPRASCAPGHQVPEAPFALLLPLSVLGFGLTVVRRRRADGRA